MVLLVPITKQSKGGVFVKRSPVNLKSNRSIFWQAFVKGQSK